MLSKDETKTRNAIKAINAMEKDEEVAAYIEGETRQDVLDAAQVQIEFIGKTATDEGRGTTDAEKNKPPDTNTAPPSPQSPPAGGDEGKKKQGETGAITTKTEEFKGGGIEGTKDVDSSSLIPRPSSSQILTGHDIIEGLDKAALKIVNERALKDAKAAATDPVAKAAAEIRKEKGIVTCEDVLARMKAEGKTV